MLSCSLVSKLVNRMDQLSWCRCPSTSMLRRRRADPSQYNSTNSHNQPIHKNRHNFWNNDAILMSLKIFNVLKLNLYSIVYFLTYNESLTVWAWRSRKAMGGKGRVTQWILTVFVEQPLPSPGSAKYAIFHLSHVMCQVSHFNSHHSPLTCNLSNLPQLYAASSAIKVPEGLVMRLREVWWLIK